jgi:mycothiol-dependent nitroreductase-like protein
MTMRNADSNFYFDPVCPFAWMTSKWSRMMMVQEDYTVHWRFISLLTVNVSVDYGNHSPPGYDVRHTAGLMPLRVAARAEAEYGRESMGPPSVDRGAEIIDTVGDEGRERGSRGFLEPILTEIGLSLELAVALDDDFFDAEVTRKIHESLSLTGMDVGTPMIHFQAPDGVELFGPMISRVPSQADAGRWWDNVVGLASFPVSPS